MKPALTDTGFLVGLFKPSDILAAAATLYIRQHRHPLLTVSPVIVETCFFLPPAEKINLLTWIRRGGLSVVDTPVSVYPQFELTMRKYADRNVDIADAALVWLAHETGIRQILTADRRDFLTFRLAGGRKFDLIEWF